MTSAPPKAIKAFVTGVIKDKLLEQQEQFTADTAETPLLALFQMELVQRGVLVSLKDEDIDIDKWDAVKTVEAVRTSIGKALLSTDGGSLPVPLMAASAVMAGRTAELCACLCHSNKPLHFRPTKDATDAVKSALKRCKEVQDARFQVLLELVAPNESITPEDRASQQAIQLLQIAEGYFLRGAQVQPDTPQMWKKAYDVILLRHNTKEEDVSPGDAAVVLSNMARIATSKGNAKRATELSLRSLESYLQIAKESSKSSSSDTDKAVAAFASPYKTTIVKPLKEAQVVLASCQQNAQFLSPEEIFVLHLLTVQLDLAQEDARMEEDAQHQYQQAQNRAAEANTKPVTGKGKSSKTTTTTTTTKSKPPSLAVIREKTRKQILAEGDPDEILGDKSPAATLRDAFLKQRETSSMRQQSAAKVLQQVLERNRDRAKALACQKKPTIRGWTMLTAYVAPYLQWIPAEADKANIQTWMNGLSDEEVSLVKTFTTLVPCLHWMTCSSTGDTKDAGIPDSCLPLVKVTLDVLVDRAVEAKQDYEAASNVLKSSTKPLDDKIRQAECARGSVQALLAFQNTDRTTTDWKAHSDEATRMAQRSDKYAAYATEYGTAFWNLLLAWNGLEQSSSPWSFCTASEARLICKSAHLSLTNAKSDWGRPISNVEQCALDMATADAECGVLSGGFANEAAKVYRGILERVEMPSGDLADAFRTIVQAHCWTGLARIALYSDGTLEGDSGPSELAQKSLQHLTSVSLDQDAAVATASWTGPAAMANFLKSHVTTSRQLVADALVRSGRLQEAKTFLEDAVRDAPKDADAAFSLGAFLLRDAFSSHERTAAGLNAAKIQLLKAAKLDSRKAGPFAFLGLWYESQKDLKRALGCYSKALLLDPPNPVAGRGVLRLTAWKSAKTVIDAAIQTTSPVNGWAWRALGKHKVMATGENDLGAVALLKALRCRDIDQPQSEAMSLFFNIGGTTGKGSEQYAGKEKAETWSELAFCYRRIGRYTAAIRGYMAAIEAAGENVSGSVLCACAEAELGLGLAEEAAEKFKRALEIGGQATKSIAAYGQGLSLLSLAQRDAQDGKAGAAYDSIRTAIEGFETSTNNFGCTQKLLGDLYSFGATLPPDVFSDSSTESDVEKQIVFVGKGESFYKAAIGFFTGISEDENEAKLLQAALITDAGANILLQSNLTAFHQCKGLSYAIHKCQDVSDLYERASVEFRQAIALCPEYAPAWCGLGCSMVLSDPILAQHSFCRSLQLDSLSPDAYSSLGFLYTAHNAFDASSGILDALTQVADSPMMWINRALILERNAASDINKGEGQKAKDSISQAADAYRAALQVVKHPSAMLGLALTCRASSSASGNASERVAAFQESLGYMLQYKGKMGSSDVSAALLEDIADLEKLASNVGTGGEDRIKSVMASATKHLEALQKSRNEFQPETVDGLDLEVIQACTSPDAIAPEEQKDEPNSNTLPLNMTLARQIVHEPHRGDLWVDLSKQLLRDSAGSNDGLKAAKVAASRAVHILTHQLTLLNHQLAGGHSSSRVVSPEDLSDALSLKYWLDNVMEPKPTKSDEVEASSEPACRTLELQKALMMCPNNKFARKALTGTVGQEAT